MKDYFFVFFIHAFMHSFILSLFWLSNCSNKLYRVVVNLKTVDKICVCSLKENEQEHVLSWASVYCPLHLVLMSWFLRTVLWLWSFSVNCWAPFPVIKYWTTWYIPVWSQACRRNHNLQCKRSITKLGFFRFLSLSTEAWLEIHFCQR